MFTISESTSSSQQCAPALPKLLGYGVTTSSTPEDAPSGCALITDLESYIRSYVRLAEACYALVIALWLVATHVWEAFDAFPYLVVTSATKRSGKTRLLELVSFVAFKSRLVANISPAALYRTIDAEKPTLLVDEAEMLSSAKTEFRSLLNPGYRRGQTVKRHDGDFETYCPKAFALIGDVHDTLRDRSIIIGMMRGEPARRFVYAAAREEGVALREMINAMVSTKAQEITEALPRFEGLRWLINDRDEEIWTPLFVLCRLLCPDRLPELSRAAADMSAAKTARPRRHAELGEEENQAQEQEYAETVTARHDCHYRRARPDHHARSHCEVARDSDVAVASFSWRWAEGWDRGRNASLPNAVPIRRQADHDPHRAEESRGGFHSQGLQA